MQERSVEITKCLLYILLSEIFLITYKETQKNYHSMCLTTGIFGNLLAAVI